MALFLNNFWCCNTTTWGSNPDRSPVAQWLNMRISPASCLPAPASRLPGLCLPASASRGPFKTRARPGVGGKPRAAGEVFRNHNTGRNSPLFKNPCPARRWGEAPCGGGGFQKSQYWPKFPSIQNPCLARRWRQAPCGTKRLIFEAGRRSKEGDF